MNFTTDLSPRLTSTPQPSGFNKYEFPSKKIVPIDWHKLASVDLHELNSGKCNMEILQDHLNHIAFCQPESEIHVENAAGQRNILKMFRLSQLIIQYLFISQDYMESQLTQSKKEHQLMLEKYNEMKVKLKEQIEEAKKIKKSNKSLTETAIYLNSLLSSMGALEHYRCPICPKAFRSKDYLVSHLQRKHPQHAASVNINSCFVQSTLNNNKEPNGLGMDQLTSTPFSQNNQSQGFAIPQLHDSQMTLKPNQFYTNKIPFKHSISFFDQPSTSFTQSHTGYVMENNNIEALNPLPSTRRESDVSGITQGFPANTQDTPKSIDIDTYKMNEMQKSFNVMNDIVLKLTKDLEEQKKMMKEQFENRKRESIMRMEEKNSMQNTYETMIQNLGEKIMGLQSRQKDNFKEDKEKLFDLIENQKEEIVDLKRSLNEKPIKRTNQTEKVNEKLKSELQKLKDEIKLIQETHVLNIQKVNEEYKNDYELKLKNEIERNKKRLEKKKKFVVEDKEKDKPKITKVKKKNSKTKEIKQEKHFRNETSSKGIKIQQYEPSGNETDETSRWYSVEKNQEVENSKKVQEERDETSDEDQEPYKSDAISDTDEDDYKSNKKFNNSKDSTFEKKNLPKNNRMYSNEDTLDSEDEDSVEESIESQIKNQVDLKQLTERNPNLWHQMKNVIKEELTRRLQQFDISEEDEGIGNRDIRSHLLHLIRMRKPLTEKYDDFIKLRKSIEREVDEKLQEKTFIKRKSNNTTEPKVMKVKDQQTKSKSFSKSFKQLASKMKFKSKQFQKSSEDPSTNKDERASNKRISDSEDSDENEEEEYEDDDDDKIEEPSTYSSANEVSSKTHVDIHNEAKRSVRRNLFPGSPLSTSPPNYSHKQNLVINKTYDNISEEEWDTESSISSVKSTPEYENVKYKQGLTSTNFYSQPEMRNEDQEIKLKKPTGPMVTKLSAKIEDQLRNRSSKKLAGSIDITGNKKVYKNGNVSDDIQEIEAISISE